MPPQQPNPAPIQSPVIVKSGHSVWFYILMTILSIIAIVIVLGVGAFIYREIQLQQARQQLQTAEQQIQTNQQQVQDITNQTTPTPATNTPPPSTTNSTGATVNNGTQTVPNDGYPTRPAGTVTVSGTASVNSVLFVMVDSSYTGAQDYDSANKVGVIQTTPMKVSNGTWSSGADVNAGSYTVLVYDGSNYKLIGTGNITVVVK